MRLARDKSAAPERRPLTGLTVDDFEALLGSRTRALAAARWTYGQLRFPSELPRSVDGVSHKVWSKVVDGCALPSAHVAEDALSEDGTRKLVVRLGESSVETVLIPTRGRSTVCVSSQAGCTRRCAFCATATLGFGRQLRADEIVAQYLLARSLAPAAAPARNVVFMGMGEPMDNLDEVLTAVRILTQSPAPQLSAQQVTVSTSGVLPGMKRFLAESKASLALSLNASTDEQRSRIMPQNDVWPLGALMEALREDRARSPRRIHFIEYVLLDGVNDQDDDAARVVKLLEGVNARVNLIPHNAWPQSPFKPSPKERVLAMHDQLNRAGLRTMVRWPRGREIAGACGQLALTAAAS